MTTTPDRTALFSLIDGGGQLQSVDMLLDNSEGGGLIPQTQWRVNSAPVSTTNPVPVVPATGTPAAATGRLILMAGNVPQTLLAASPTPATVVISNPLTPFGQSVATAESAWVDPVGWARPRGGSSSIEIPPGKSLSIGPTISAITWVAASAGHMIGVYTMR